MAINKEHPDYSEYIEKCKAMNKTYIDEEDALRAQYPDWRGKDHPATDKLLDITKRHNAALKALQREYAHLFTSGRIKAT